jgi:anti-anti-sigma factor
MTVNYKIEGDSLIIALEGHLNGENADCVKEDVLKIIEEHPDAKVVFDAQHLNYISSMGLRVLLTIQKMKQEQQGKIEVREVGRGIFDVFRMTGFTKLMDVMPKLHEISVEGKEIVGQGQSSTVYRINNEFIVKLYNKLLPLEKIRQEIDFARKAFVAGVPTAITFNLVKCGDSALLWRPDVYAGRYRDI